MTHIISAVPSTFAKFTSADGDVRVPVQAWKRADVFRYDYVAMVAYRSELVDVTRFAFLKGYTFVDIEGDLGG